MLVIRPRGGLCNYLRHVFGWYSYARSIDSQLVVIWEETCYCNGFFLDYFKEIDGITFLRDNGETYEFASNGWHGPHSPGICQLHHLKLRKYMIKIIKRRIKKINGINKGWVDVGRKNINGNVVVKQKKIITSGLERKKIIIKVKNSKNSKNGKNGKNGNRLKKEKKVKKLKNKYNSVHIRRTDHIGFAKSRNGFTYDKEFNTFIKNKNKNKNKSIHLLIVGTGSKEYVDKLKNIALKLGIDNKVIFVGFSSESLRIIASLDLLISSSNNEPFGRTIVEAMIQNTSVLAAYGAGHNETINPGITGYLYKHESLEDFSKQCDSNLNNKVEKEKIIKNANESVFLKYSSFQHAEAILKIYKSVIIK